MSTGDNIKKVRKKKGLTLKQLGDLLGVDESYVRAYESGRRIPKQKSLEAFAKALDVNADVLRDFELDSFRTMHLLFKMFELYNGQLSEEIDEDGTSHIRLELRSLKLMHSWYERYLQYQQELKSAESITNSSERTAFINAVTDNYIQWINTYPTSDTNSGYMGIQIGMDRIRKKEGKLPDEWFE